MVPAVPDPARDPELVALAAELLSGLDEFSAAVVDQIRVRIPFYAAGIDVAYADNLHAVSTNVERVLRSFAEAGPPDVSAARATGRARGEANVPLPMVMAAFRVGFSAIWSNLLERAHRSGSASSDALVRAASQIWSTHDTFAEAMADSYRDAVFADMLRTEHERSALVAALLDGRISDELTSWDAADVLRLPGQGPFVVVAAEVTQVAQEALPGAETRLRLVGVRSAWRLLPDYHIGIVRLSSHRQRELLTQDLKENAPARVGVSPDYAKLTDTAAHLRFARMALAAAPPGRSTLRFFEDDPLGIATVNASDATVRLVHSVLGPVLDLSHDERTLLLATLAAWRDNGGSAEAAGHQLYCHANTVRLRLHRIEDVTGRRLSDPRSSAELLLTLAAVEASPNSYR